MKKALKLQANAATTSNADVSHANILFHEAVAEATRNSLFVDVIRSVNEAANNTWVIWAKLPSHDYEQIVSTVVAEHRKVYDAILRQDPDRARAAMQSHLSTAVDRMLGVAEAGIS